MLTYDAWAFPDGETHLPAKLRKANKRVDGRLTYQYPLYAEGLRWCKARRVAVDVGAHVGLFSYWMVRDFAQLIAVEPVAAHRACWEQNVRARPGDRLLACAFGAAVGAVQLAQAAEGSSGGTYVAGPGEIPMLTLDSLTLEVLDLLKIDTEGYESDVIKGGLETLARCHPVCIVEQRPAQVARYPQGKLEAVRRLERLGAVIVWTDRRDYVLVWP